MHVPVTKTPLYGLLQLKPALRKSSDYLWTVQHLLCSTLLYASWYPQMQVTMDLAQKNGELTCGDVDSLSAQTTRHWQHCSHKPGEKVRVRKPHHVPKAHPRFSHPATVRKKIGPNSFLLSDGKTWNASQWLDKTVTLPDCHTPILIIISLTNSHVLNTSQSGIRTILCCNLRCLRIWTVEMILVTLVTL